MKRCPVCGLENNDFDGHCQRCHALLNHVPIENNLENNIDMGKVLWKKYCPQCGQENEPDCNVCKKCQTNLAFVVQSPQKEQNVTFGIILEFPNGALMPITRKQTMIGRNNPKGDLYWLKDVYVENNNALIYFKEKTFFIKDCSKKNGVLLNDRIISNEQLKKGDQLLIGITKVIIKGIVNF